MEPAGRSVPLLPPPRRADGPDGTRAARRRHGGERRYRDDPFEVDPYRGGGYAETERWDPFYEPGIGMRAGGRVLYNTQKIGQEMGRGMHWDPHDMATSAYAQSALLGKWY